MHAIWFKDECTVFTSVSNNCTLYKWAGIGSEKISETTAGICPKYDKPKYGEVPVPDGKQLWCGEASGSICTFPFKINGSKLIYEPYKDSQGVSRCGTEDNSTEPIEYASVNDLDAAIPCKGKWKN